MTASDLGLVIIGRNEGERLRTCLRSCLGEAGHPVVYVDSGSTDGSCELARAMGARVVELDLSIPFTAARARNAGAAQLLEIEPELAFIQFVDGDCELCPGWLDRARQALLEHPDWSVVCGRLRERYPERTLWNRLADLEWRVPVGEARGCGGIAMYRTEPFQRAGGFDASIIAGEEPELCLRLRRLGGRIFVLDAEMALHDIAMTRASQWWRRMVRGGHAYAEAWARHGRSPDRFRARDVASILIWGGVAPALALGLAWPTRGLSLAVWAVVVLLHALRAVVRLRQRGFSRSEAWLCAASYEVGKFPQLIGALRYAWNRLRRRGPRLIEYKGAERPEDAEAGQAVAGRT